MRTFVTALVVAASVFSAIGHIPTPSGEDPTKPVPWSCAPGTACDQGEPLTTPATVATTDSSRAS